MFYLGFIQLILYQSSKQTVLEYLHVVSNITLVSQTNRLLCAHTGRTVLGFISELYILVTIFTVKCCTSDR